MNKFFYVDETPYFPGRFVIRLHHEKFGFSNFRGSCNCIPAKLMMISYANYLRLCRDVYGAELNGKNTKYPIALFKDKKNAEALVKELNRRAAQVVRPKTVE
jgi:hypothetical protein